MDPVRAQTDSLMPSQRLAVEARGNVLVMAGAGTGKTRTLVERCMDCLCRERASLDEILVVTFTEAAATEMKQRLRIALEQTPDLQPLGAPKQNEGGSALRHHLSEQLALFDTAFIGTLHSFCLRLVREHFFELGLDPQLAVLDPGEAGLIAGETLDDQFRLHYSGQTEFSVAVQNLIRVYGNGEEQTIRAMVLRLHHHAQTRPDADRWLTEQLAQLAPPEPVEWRKWLNKAIQDWRDEWLPVLKDLKAANEKAAELFNIFEPKGGAGVPLAKSGIARNSSSAGMFEKILAADDNYPPRRKTALREPLKEFFADATFLHSLMPSKNSEDPLAEDWNWVRGHMTALLQLTQEFGQNFAERKRADGVLDFHDLEQFALKLLWDSAADKPSSIAGRWQQKIRFVFVDEYQDINAAQDRIIQALSREDAESNRFLVGDVKQSIYRFRLAEPAIFRRYAQEWRGESGQVVGLTENFRSRESLLGFINSFFEVLMRAEIGGVEYDSGARLQFGKSEGRTALGIGRNPSPRADLLLRIKGRSEEDSAEDDPGEYDLAELEETEKEARLVAQRLRELVAQAHKVWDEGSNDERAVEWRDMAILLRAPANKAEAYAKEFDRAGVPLTVERGGFYDSTEIADLLNLLKLLDNPLQDIPMIAVLRSPLVGLSLDELATIRLAAKNVPFWTALNRRQNAEMELDRKVGEFLDRFSRWRQLARQASLSQCLECVLGQTHYADWVRSHRRGAQRQANIERFVSLAQQFDQFQRQGLFRFLKFIEAQRGIDAEPEVAAAMEENAVRLMSIHQSKGLEFPVVVVADLGKPFNDQDLRGEIIFDEQFGLCPRVKPPHAGRRYPSLPHWLARRRQKRELRGEELRLLYVAMTRARDTLILTATLSKKQWESFGRESPAITAGAILAARSYADWLGLWFQIQGSKSGVQDAIQGELPHLTWRTIADDELARNEERETRIGESDPPILDEVTAKQLRRVLNWEYAFKAATERAAKSSVTALRRQAEESDDEAEPVFPRARIGKQEAEHGKARLLATEIGAAHHRFLQHAALGKVNNLAALGAEAARLETAGILTAEERAALDVGAMVAFWKSEPGRKILAQPQNCIKRELPFTARFSPAEVDAITGATTPPGLDGEFIVVQGVADLVVLLPREIWLVDFKTDEIKPGELRERKRHYEPQLKLYAAALSRIYGRPVRKCWLHFLAVQRTIEIEL